MQSGKRFRPLLGALLGALLIAACGRAEPPEPTATPSPTATVPSTTPTPVPTVGEPLPAGQRTFRLLPGASRAQYQAEEEFLSGAAPQLGKALGITSTIGSTNQIQGTFTLDVRDGLQIVGGLIEVDISTLASDDPRRDRAIRERFLQSDTYPTATFVPLEMEGFPATYNLGDVVHFKLTGDLTIRDITQRVTFNVRASYDGQRIRGDADAVLRMTQFGFDPPAIANLLTVADSFLLQIFFTAEEADG